MSKVNTTENVREQYQDDTNLAIRVRLHEKHSTNRQGFGCWLFEKYEFREGFRILELGCGNGIQWENNIGSLPPHCTLVLSDLSEGMVEAVWEKYSRYTNMLPQRIDIQNIPFPDSCFDVVIANHMLYHVPDLDRALSEVRRVLREGGTFYSSTTGNGGLRAYVHNARKQIHPDTPELSAGISFSMQNGADTLREYFGAVQRHDFEDSLHITQTQDLIDWIKSTATISDCADDYDALYDYFEGIRVRGGAIDIPKEAGLFVSTKSGWV